MRYLVKLKPMEPFFFGGEQTFGKDDARREGARYSATSTYFPQQTALLGMLRKTLLIQNNNLTMHLKGEWIDSTKKENGGGKNYHEAVSLTGKDAFSYNKSIDLGVIKEISPLFITQGEEHFIINAKDSDYELTKIPNANILTSKKESAFLLKGYNTKEYKEDTFISSTDKTLSYDSVFQKVQTVGIKKSEEGASEDDAFFQKTSYMLKGDAHFSFYLDVEMKLDWKKAYVNLGADQSSFMLELEPTQEHFDNLFQDTFAKKEHSRIVLTSETLLSKEAYDLCYFVFATRQTYRQLNSKNGDKSKRYYLLERGGVLYTDRLDKLVATLSQPHLQRVGINQFIAIKGA